MYAVRDRVDYSTLPETPRSVIDASKVLIKDDDIKQLNKDLVVLIKVSDCGFVTSVHTNNFFFFLQNPGKTF